MLYPTLDKRNAENALRAREQAQPLDEDWVTWKGSGERFREASARELIDALDLLRNQPGSREGKAWGHRFDAAGAGIVHRWVRNEHLAPRMQGDQGFWRWLAVWYGFELLRWRYGGDEDAPLKRENFGIKGTRENAFFRMYQIGSIVYIPNADGSDPENAYDLAHAADSDFWRSHILRQNYANALPVARVLAQLQAGLLESERPLDNLEIRELAKDLKRLRANIVFEVMTDHGAQLLILERVPLARQRAAEIKAQKRTKDDEARSDDDSAGVPLGAA